MLYLSSDDRVKIITTRILRARSESSIGFHYAIRLGTKLFFIKRVHSHRPRLSRVLRFLSLPAIFGQIGCASRASAPLRVLVIVFIVLGHVRANTTNENRFDMNRESTQQIPVASQPVCRGNEAILPTGREHRILEQYREALKTLRSASIALPKMADLIVATDSRTRAEMREAIDVALSAAGVESHARKALQRLSNIGNIKSALASDLASGAVLKKQVLRLSARADVIFREGDGIPRDPGVLNKLEVVEIYKAFYYHRERFWTALHVVPFVRDRVIGELRDLRDKDRSLTNGSLLLLNRSQSEEQLIAHVDSNLATAQALLARYEQTCNSNDLMKVARLLVETPLPAEDLNVFLDDVERLTRELRTTQDGNAEMHASLAEQLGGNLAYAESQYRMLVELRRPYQRLKDYLVNANRGLVGKVVQSLERIPDRREDLMQDATIGLMRAIEKFDIATGHSFSTLATWWIEQAVTRNRSFYYHPVSIPVYQLQAATILARHGAEDRNCSNEELGKKYQINPEIVAALRKRGRAAASLSPRDDQRGGLKIA